MENNRKALTLSDHRQHKIYLAAIMGYGIGTEDPEEIAYYNKVKAKINKDKKNINMGVPRDDL